MRRLKRLIAAATLAALLAFPSRSQAAPALRMLLDQNPLTFDVPPQILSGRTLVPFRGIAQALGATVTYDAATHGIHAVGLGHDVTLVVGSKSAVVDGQPVTLDVAAQVIAGRTLVPLRFFAAAFGAGVGYDAAARTVRISSPQWHPTTLAFYAIRAFPERNLIPRFDQVAFGWSTLTARGDVDFASSPDYHWPEPAGEITPERILQDAAGSGELRLLMVQMMDGTGDLTRLVTNASLRATAAAHLAAAAKQKGVDGIELDLEGLGLTETGADLDAIQRGFTDLVAQTATRLHQDHHTLVVSLPPPNGAYHGYDMAAVAKSVDLIELMAHDYRQDGQPEPADLVQEAITESLDQVPAYKLLLGINLPVESAQSLVDKVGMARAAHLRGLAFWRLGMVGPERLASLQAQKVLRP